MKLAQIREKVNFSETNTWSVISIGRIRPRSFPIWRNHRFHGEHRAKEEDDEEEEEMREGRRTMKERGKEERNAGNTEDGESTKDTWSAKTEEKTKARSEELSLSLALSLSICRSVYLSICLSVDLSLCFSRKQALSDTYAQVGLGHRNTEKSCR